MLLQQCSVAAVHCCGIHSSFAVWPPARHVVEAVEAVEVAACFVCWVFDCMAVNVCFFAEASRRPD